MNKTPFILGNPPESKNPLARFLPQIPANIASNWLSLPELNLEKNKWILDPFGSSPSLIIETAQSGYPVLVAANNPINRFLIEMAAMPPRPQDFLSGFAALASSLRGNERIENHIMEIYRIDCLECGKAVEVDAFLWERNSPVPYGVIYNCEACGFEGERILPHNIAENANEFASNSLHRSRALERVASRADPDRIFVEEALSVYSPRAIYVLFTLINKVDSLHITLDEQKALQALLLSACDIGNVMWDYPSRRDRPRQLTIPSKYRENNIWKIMEQAISYWSEVQTHVPLSIWPNLPDSDSGICIYEGPLRNLIFQSKEDQPQLEFQAALTAIPRPNQAFWTLSALWSGWLWGREAVGPFKSVLRRRRYDWNWLYSALHAVFENIAQFLDPDIPILGLTAEAEAGLLTATTHAAYNCGFDLTGFATRDKEAQFHWRFSASGEKRVNAINGSCATKSIREFLIDYGQPAPFLKVWSAGLAGLFNYENNTAANKAEEIAPESEFAESNALIRDILTYRGGFLRFGSSDSMETSLWWLKEDSNSNNFSDLNIADQMEIAVVKLLTKNKTIKKEELENLFIQQFPGLQTPDTEWLQVILESYAVENSNKSGYWSLRNEDQPSSRREDLKTMQKQLNILAERFGYDQSEESPLVWSKEGSNQFYFYLIASAVLSNVILRNEVTPISPSHKSIIVLPGGRANLVVYKLRLDPRLHRLCSSDEQSELPGWRFIKMRHLRWLLDNATQFQAFQDQLTLDPLTFTTPQMRFI